MRTLWTGRELKELFPGNDHIADSASIMGIAIDSRQVKEGDLFIPLEGQTDGHLFIQNALDQGAALSFSKKKVDVSKSFILKVQDTLQALTDLGQAAKKRSSAHRIAITGSVGKTTTKEIMGHVFSKLEGIHYSKASYNNHIGVPYTLATMPKDTETGIFELGMNNRGEIMPLSKQVNPHVVVITMLAPSHIGRMRSMEEIVSEKGDILEGMQDGGSVILNTDHDNSDNLKKRAYAQKSDVYTYGEKSNNDAYIASYTPLSLQEYAIRAVVMGEDVSFKFNLQGIYNAVNVLPTLLLAKIKGYELKPIIPHLESIKPFDRRGEIETVNNVTIINDAYNANLCSMTASITVLDQAPCDGRKICVLGEMRELGAYSDMHHVQVATFLNESNIDSVFVSGEAAKPLYNALEDEKKVLYALNADDLTSPINKYLKDGDTVLFKGSLGSNIHKIVPELKSLLRKS